MSTDQSQPVIDSGESVGAEVADYFKAENQTPEDHKEQVNSDDKEIKPVVAEQTKENDSEGKQGEAKPTEGEKPEEAKPTEDKKTTDTKDEDGEDKKPKGDNVQPTEFEVAGKKYTTFDEAVKAVNRISGDNTRISGNVSKLNSEKAELESKLSETSALLEKFKEANQLWQKHFDGDGDRPDTSKLDIESLIDNKLKLKEELK